MRRQSTVLQQELEKVTLAEWARIQDRAHVMATPVQITGGLVGSGLEHFAPEVIEASYGDVEVPITTGLPEAGVPYDVIREPRVEHMTVSEFLKSLREGVPCYLCQVPLLLFPGLIERIDVSQLSLRSVWHVNLWIGASTRSGLHFDSADNLFAQIHGYKRVYLFDPKEARNLYQYADCPTKSKVDPEVPDFDRFPRFSRCQMHICRLGPGDLLYIPRGWWHFVAADGISVSVNCWHGRALEWSKLIRLYAAAGPALILEWLRGFLVHGLLGRPYKTRLFSPPPLGILSYRHFCATISSLFRMNTSGDDITG